MFEQATAIYNRVTATYKLEPARFNEAPTDFIGALVIYNEAPATYKLEPASSDRTPATYIGAPATYKLEPASSDRAPATTYFPTAATLYPNSLGNFNCAAPETRPPRP